VVSNQDKLIMSVKGGNNGKEIAQGRETLVPEGDFAPGDLKIKLPDEFEGNRSKLDSFLAQCKLYMAFNKHKFKMETQ
jgi:hypothetical protein